MTKLRDTFLRVDVDDDGTKRAAFVDHVPDDAQVLVCIAVSVPLVLPDNLLGTCDACRCGIQFRPAAAATPIKVCTHCAADWMEAPPQ